MSRQTVVEGHGRALRILALALHDDYRGVGEEIGESATPGELAATATIMAMLFAQFVESTAAAWGVVSDSEAMTGAELWAMLAPQVQEPPPGTWDWEEGDPATGTWWRRALRGRWAR